MTYPSARALIAEDEPLLATALRQQLAEVWPALKVVACVGDGLAAVREALVLLPEVLFFDIRMPGQGGLEAAAELMDAWPDGRALPLLVFTTAYDQYAVQAFEAQAMDYLLKPITPQRLEKSVQKVALALYQQARAATDTEVTLTQLRQLLAAPLTPASPTAPPAPRLNLLQVDSGGAIRLLPTSEVLYFEAADKYVRVLTVDHEYLIRTPLKELIAQLDPQAFWQVHRGTLVRAQAIESARRDEAGRTWLTLRGRGERLAVSRLYASLFKAM